MGGRKQPFRIPLSMSMAGYTIPVVFVDRLAEDGDDLDGLFIAEGHWLGPAICIDGEYRKHLTGGDTFVHELVEAAAHFAKLNHDQRCPTRFTHDKLEIMARYIWEGLSSAKYGRHP